MLFKYGSDAALIYATTGHVWTPLQYLSPAFTTRDQLTTFGPDWLLVVLVLWTLPFLWIGLAMTLKRACDAGRSPALALWFLFPGVNYLAMIYLATLPTAAAAAATDPRAEDARTRRIAGWAAALAGAGLGAGIAVAMTLVSTLVFGEYGISLFFATPALVGASAAWLYNRDVSRTLKASLGVAALAVVMAGGALLLFAIEGAICLLMAAPLGLPLGLIGGVMGRAIAQGGAGTGKHMLAICCSLPLLAGAESQLSTGPPLREVTTSVVIDASPEAVWANVIGFAELDEAPGWLHRLGVAYPMRARIEGRGVGAVRYCEFSTGAFVEPITVWEPGQRLAFDVIEQPVPMHEWSPYRHVHPPHLDGYLRSERGEFRLIALPDGRTRLEGSTWYTMDLAPSSYWTIWSDTILHGIHLRVLRHVSRLSEAGFESVPGEREAQ